MKKTLLLISLAFMIIACDNTTEYREYGNSYNLVPAPKKFEVGASAIALTVESKMYTNESELEKLLLLFQKELKLVHNFEIGISNKKDKSADIIFELNDEYKKEEYSIKIDKKINVKAGSYQAAVMAKNTLLQHASHKDGLVFNELKIHDYPDAEYRGLMIDLARNWHTIDQLKQLIDMASYYKLNYVQLHFTDYQSYTLPSKHYPNLATENKTYSFDELKDLEAYSQLRGITIIPEIDVPGHSLQFTEKYPEIFGIKDIKENPWIINMGKEEVYEALDLLIGEMCEIFSSTPYFHIGGDEAIFHKVMDDPDVQNYIKEHGIENDAHELYRHFIVRMNDIVKNNKKQLCVWEGFRPKGIIPIPKDIIVYEYETNRYLPQELIRDGYTVVNTSWKPLYVVNKKKWEPKTIYDWNLWHWGNWFPKAPSFEPIQLEKTPLIIGGQMCAWEQAADKEVPSLRKRLPVFLERIWNTEKKMDFESFMVILEQTDSNLTKLIKDDRQDSLLHGHNFTAEME